MKKQWTFVLALAAAGCFLLHGLPAVPGGARAGETPGAFYTGDEATGPDVLALWQFLPGAETEDSSGRGHTLTLQGAARIHTDGKFGSSLAPGRTGRNQAQGALSDSLPALSPKSAFTLDLWMNPDPDLANRETAHLVDKMAIHYIHEDRDREYLRDYMMLLSAAGRRGRHQVEVHLGFDREGGMTTYTSEPVSFQPGTWHHIAFTYDGAGGGRITVDGKRVGEEHYSFRGPVAPGSRGVMIGDRGISLHDAFPGRIDQVRLLNRVQPFISGAVELRLSTHRRHFLRMEKEAAVGIEILNATGTTLEEAALTLYSGGTRTAGFAIPALSSGEHYEIRHPVDTTLRAGTYPLNAVLEAGDHRAVLDIDVHIVERDLPHSMPVVAWDLHQPQWGPFNDVTERFKDVGFTHRFHHRGGIDKGMVWQAGEPMPNAPAEEFRRADEALGLGMKACMVLAWSPSFGPKRTGTIDADAFNRVRRTGRPIPHFNPCGRFPELQEFCYQFGASVAQAYHAYPAWDAALIQSERRDVTVPCFHDHDREAFREHSGHDIPPEATVRFGVDYRNLADFPRNRILPDDNPILAYYRWFWKDGDGWNALHRHIHEGIKSTGREDVWTWFDPAVRVPAVWGNAAALDVLSHWTYTYPNPEVIGLSTDEIFAMAEGSGQDVMKMTQVIWYRSQTAPEVQDEVRAEWETGIHADPGRARWITISPDHLRIAFWSKLARPIQGLMYHGLNSLLPLDPEDTLRGYRYTHPGAADALKDLVARVVEPLGPTLVQIPDPEPRMAVLQSFTSQIFAGVGTLGWGGAQWPRAGTSWAADSYLALRHAQFQPKIVYEEAIRDGVLDGIEILFMTECPVLPASVAEKVRAFQRRGGIVVGDENLSPGIAADLLLRSFERPEQGDRSRQALLDTAARIRHDLDLFAERFTDTDNPDVLTRLRRYGSTDYVFAYNDARTFGAYLGHHGRVMEDGVPASATVKVRRDGGHVYDLLEHREVMATAANGWIEIPRGFAAGEGRLWMITAQPIGDVRVQAPSRVRRGERFEIDVSVTDPRHQTMDAVVPVRVEIFDARGEPMEFSGHYGARDGRVRIAYDTAANDEPGDWTVRATELAAGKTAETAIYVE